MLPVIPFYTCIFIFVFFSALIYITIVRRSFSWTTMTFYTVRFHRSSCILVVFIPGSSIITILELPSFESLHFTILVRLGIDALFRSSIVFYRIFFYTFLDLFASCFHHHYTFVGYQFHRSIPFPYRSSFIGLLSSWYMDSSFYISFCTSFHRLFLPSCWYIFYPIVHHWIPGVCTDLSSSSLVRFHTVYTV